MGVDISWCSEVTETSTMIQTSSSTSIPIFFVGIVGFIIFWLVVGIALAIWVYRDAESRGMGGVLWLIVVLITGIVGLIIYLIVREPRVAPTSTRVSSSTRFCPNCGRGIPADVAFCPHCGKPTAG
jgi:preprotein translocase subunit Sss1